VPPLPRTGHHGVTHRGSITGRRMTTMSIAATLLGVLLLAWPAAITRATELFAYPNKGQSDAQQHKDQVDCGGWAARQSGSSAAAEPEATASPKAERGAGGGIAHGMLRGRMIGGAAGNSSAGAMGGGMAAIVRRRMIEKKQQQAAGQGQTGEQSAFNRAFKACMEGRGYTVE
jgi:hypothetical protein